MNECIDVFIFFVVVFLVDCVFFLSREEEGRGRERGGEKEDLVVVG